MNTLNRFFIILFASLFLLSCGDDDNQPEPFQAAVTVDSVYSPGTTVTLDASASQGIDGAIVEWRVNVLPTGFQESDLISAGFERNAVTTSFTVERIGTYNFLLQITKNGQISTANASFTVSGILEISSLADLNGEGFKNLDGLNEAEVGDYLINSILVIDDFVQIEPNTTLMFGPNGGLDIQGNLNSGDNLGNTGAIYLTAQQDDFVGIKLSGSINAASLTIKGGGNSSFTSDPDDAAAMFYERGTNLNIGSSIVISSSPNYGLVISKDADVGGVGFNFTFMDNAKTAKMSSIEFIRTATSYNVQDLAGATIDIYFEEETNNLSGTYTVFDLNLKVLDSLIIEENVTFDFRGTHLQFNPGAYLRATKSGSNLNADGAIFESIDPQGGALWSGIVARFVFLQNCEIRNAGGAIVPGASEQAGISLMDNGSSASISSCIFEDNIGWGIYNEGTFANIIGGCDFSNNSAGHVKTFWTNVDAFNTDNTFSPGVVAVEAFDPHNGNSFNGLTISEVIEPLGGDAFYLFKTNAAYEGLRLEPNVHIKMGLNLSFDVRTDFVANGTASEPIIIEGENNNQGYWQGLRIQDDASMSFVEILDGGSNDGATTYSAPFSAGLTVQSAPNRNVSVTDCEISNSGGYGVVIKQGAGDFAIDSTASNNTLQGALGAYYDDN